MSVDEFKEHYNSNMIKEIMYCNKDMTSGKMSIDLEGIMKLEFESDNIKSVYYVVAKEQ
jgi:phenylalanine-4-hydroxylase